MKSATSADTANGKAKRFIVKMIGRHTRAIKEFITIVDAKDANLMRSYYWSAICNHPRHLEGGNVYIIRKGTKGDEFLHSVIADAKPGEMVMHINGNSLDNRRANLLRQSERVQEIEE